MKLHVKLMKACDVPDSLNSSDNPANWQPCWIGFQGDQTKLLAGADRGPDNQLSENSGNAEGSTGSA